MTSYLDYLVQCPQCASWLAGKKPVSETLNHSQLWSDGKSMNEISLVGECEVIRCPACAHDFWADEAKHIESRQAEYHQLVNAENGQLVYSWASWRDFGCNLNVLKGKLALIGHYERLLRKWPGLEMDKVFHLRQWLLWAYNDLIRDLFPSDLSSLMKGNLSLMAWVSNLKINHEARKKFIAMQAEYRENLHALIVLTGQHAVIDPLRLIELYREQGDFMQAKTLAGQETRHTHLVAALRKRISRHDSLVFKVAG
ncbi:MAG: hypothetical protein KGZ82_12830 [Bacteroidales bacterium]|nr:hypothetical protein [Bacteroidales bacterium]